MKMIGYLTIGYPDLETSLTLAGAYVRGGCDAIELGMPTKNPFMEGQSIFHKMSEAARIEPDYEHVFSAVEAFAKNNPKIELFPIFYKEVFLRLGYERILRFCKECGINKLLSVDMDQEQIVSYMRKNDINFVSFAGFEVAERDVEKALENGAFLYMAAVPRPTDTLRSGMEDMKSILAYLRQRGVTCPIYCGGGIRTPADVRKLREDGADGFFLGSSLMDHYSDTDKLVREIQCFKHEAN